MNMIKKDLSVHPIFGISIVSESKDEVLNKFIDSLEDSSSREVSLVFTPNPEQIAMSFHDPKFSRELTESTWNLPDGEGLVWALKRQVSAQGEKLRVHRIPGREVFHDLLEKAGEKGWKVFLLGGKPGSAQVIADNIQHPISPTSPRLRGAGNFQLNLDEGAKDIRHETQGEAKRVLEEIAAFRPKILFIAYGAPWQERWLLDHKNELSKAGVKLAMVVGGAFEYEAGLVPQVPSWIGHLHLEWLWRLLSQPWRW